MQWLTWIFLIAVVAETLTRLWLGSRQLAAVQAHRDAEHQKEFGGKVGPLLGGRPEIELLDGI